jgi:hypothetical protein
VKNRPLGPAADGLAPHPAAALGAMDTMYQPGKIQEESLY